MSNHPIGNINRNMLKTIINSHCKTYHKWQNRRNSGPSKNNFFKKNLKVVLKLFSILNIKLIK